METKHVLTWSKGATEENGKQTTAGLLLSRLKHLSYIKSSKVKSLVLTLPLFLRQAETKTTNSEIGLSRDLVSKPDPGL